jgi:HEAT repeat protein
MAPADRSGVEKHLGELLEAERRVQALLEEIAAMPADRVIAAVTGAISRARARSSQEERVVDLCALARLLGRVGGPRATDALVDLLGSDEPEVRYAAGDVLTDVGHDRWKELALAVERAIDSLPAGNPALAELPYVLAEIPEPGATKLLHRFLGHADPEAVAAAIEISADLGDDSAVPLLTKLENDKRMVMPDDETSADDEAGSMTIGELATEARILLESAAEGD